MGKRAVDPPLIFLSSFSTLGIIVLIPRRLLPPLSRAHSVSRIGQLAVHWETVNLLYYPYPGEKNTAHTQ